MAIYRCKSCGGELDVTSNLTVVECDYCGIKQTIPTVQDENIQGLFNRANVLRMKGEFDKAEQIYEKILQVNDKEAEAYWGMILCKYGIEYVEDPATFKRVPTCHRASFDSITADEDYKAALTYADAVQRSIYEAEAAAIEEIQKGILAISRNEKPYDVFICYKETDENGKRTIDSTIANDIYHQLTQEGMKVFYAAITLEDKLGQEYEPYIFAALNSAKIMLVLGTKPQYFSAVWVKNEWSRFLKIMKADRSKMLIPCYRDMDAYELPEEFAHLQAQDMSKIGFINDVIRGIKKVVNPEETAQQRENVVVSANANTEPLLKRAFIFLEDKDWNSADEYCEKVLDLDPENAQAYLGKLMASLRVSKKENLTNCGNAFRNDANYQKVCRYGTKELIAELEKYNQQIDARNEERRLQQAYEQAAGLLRNAKTEEDYKKAAQAFERVSEYRDAKEKVKECLGKAREELYKHADRLLKSAESEAFYKKAAEAFGKVGEYKDAKEKVKECLEKAEVARKDSTLEYAEKTVANETDIKNLEIAIRALQSLSGWKNADELVVEAKKKIEEIKEHERRAEEERKEAERKEEEERKECERLTAERAKRNKKIAMIVMPIACVLIGITIYMTMVVMPSNQYNEAIALMNAGKLDEAQGIFKELGGFKDAEDQFYNIFLKKMSGKLEDARVGAYIKYGTYEQDNDTSNGKEDIEWLVLDEKDGRILVISKYALNSKPYHTEETSITWEDSSLRKWLNDDFMKEAFSDEEKTLILTEIVPTEKNMEWDTDLGVPTQDQVFLLGINQVNSYFSSDDERECKATAYAVDQGAHIDIRNGNCWWWLRTRGYNEYRAAIVGNSGGIGDTGVPTYDDSYAVRPALWIDLNTVIF